MSFFDKIKDIITDNDEDDFDDFYDNNTSSSIGLEPPVRDRSPRREKPQRADREERFTERPHIKKHDNDKVVNIHTTAQLQVVLVKPERFDEAAAIGDNLNEKRTVVLNLESTNREIARRLLDFLSGVTYANKATMRQVASDTFMITPFNVDVNGDLLSELGNNGYVFDT